jgi:hypothetical protein
LGNFTNWNGQTSLTNISNWTNGIVTGRHTIISNSNAFWDINTNGALRVPPLGFPFCARLGNDGVGRQQERLRYDFTVTSSVQILIYRYAVVLEDPGHPITSQPYFKVSVLNSNGQPLGTSGCYTYYQNATSAGSAAGWNTAPYGVRWLPWKTEAISLTNIPIGTNLILEFETADCGAGAHYGYAYLMAECKPAQIQQIFCAGQNQITLEAPLGFSYQWNNGSSSRVISITNPTIGSTYSVTMTSASGCQVTLSTVISPDVVTPSISGPTAVCVGQTVTFTDNSTSSRSPITNREWTLPSGTFVTTVPTATFTPSAPGTYRIYYKGINQTGCFDTTSIPLIVHPNPVAAFTADTICIGQPVSITNQSSPASNLTYSWSFSNGTTSNLATPTNTIAAPGTYSATLTATDTLTGCDASTTRTFIVLNTPTQTNPQVLGLCKGTTYDLREYVNFVPSVDTSLVQFSGTNVVNGHLWNTAGLAAGLYTVQVSINAPGACPYSGTLSLQLDDIDAQINPVTPVCKGDSLWVSSSSSSALSPLTNFNWYFQGQSYIGGPDSVLFIALNNGTFPLTLAVQNQSGCWDSTTVNVVIHPNPTAQFTPGLSCARIPTAFTSNSSFPSGGPGQYQWIFSDGQTATVASPSLVFAAPGAYSATLWVTDLSTGCTDSASLSFTVEPKPALVPEIIQVCPQTQVDLSDEFSTDIPATITFSGSSIWSVGTRAPGIYYVPVSITSSAGCTYPDTLQIEVLPVPTAVITQIPIQCYNSPTINLLDYVSAPSSTLISFDGAFVTGNFFSFSDAAVGTNTVAIYLIDANTGCRDTLSTTVTVRPRPRIDFTAYHKLCIQTPPFTPWGFKPEGGQLYSPLLDANDQFHPMNAGEGVHAIGYIYCDPYGCCDTVFQDLDVRMDSCSVEMFIPNTFTHNQDGVNDSYRFGYHGVIENFEVEIVNRWGERVFYSEDPDFIWDANNLNEGAYNREKLDVYVVRARWTEFKYTDFWEPERRFRRFIGPLYLMR